jgi:hypothetical protein
MVEYHIELERVEEFLLAMKDLERVLRRDGATRWGLFADPAEPGRYFETFLVESWAEHMRQHARVTIEDRAVQERVRSFHLGDSPPQVTHLIAEDFSRLKRPLLGRIRRAGREKNAAALPATNDQDEQDATR